LIFSTDLLVAQNILETSNSGDVRRSRFSDILLENVRTRLEDIQETISHPSFNKASRVLWSVDLS